MPKACLFSIAFISSLLLSHTLTAQVNTLLYESFETDGHGVRYTVFPRVTNDPYPSNSDGGFYDGTGDYIMRTFVSSLSSSFLYTPTGMDSTYFFAFEDTDDNGHPVSDGVATIQFDSISIAGYDSLKFSFLIATPRNDKFDNKLGTVNNQDSITFLYRFNSTGNWIPFARFTGANSSNGALKEDSDFDGLPDGIVIGNGSSCVFQSVQKEITGSANLIDVRVVVDVNGGSEEVALDKLVLTGVVASSGTPMSAQLQAGHIPCFGENTGSVSVMVSGGTAGYNYYWSNGFNKLNTTDTLNSQNQLSAGTYSVTVVDASNDTVIKSVTLTQPAKLTASITVNNHVSCFGLSDGELTVKAIGGTGNHNFLWNTSDTLASLNQVPAGNYSVIISDSNQCKDSATAQVNQPAQFTHSIFQGDTATLCNGDTLSLHLNPSSASSKVQWFNAKDTAKWSLVGNAGVSAERVSDVKLVAGSKNYYAVYRRDKAPFKLFVQQYDGNTWTELDTSGISMGGAWSISADIYKDTLYVAYRDAANGYGATVKKFDGSSWSTVGSAGFSASSVNYMDLRVNRGVPYVVYADNAGSSSNRFKATAMKFNGTNWVLVGSQHFSHNTVAYTSLAFKDTVPYMAFRGNLGGKSTQATVMKFNGTSWVLEGSKEFTPGRAEFNDLEFDDNGTPYLAFQDWSNSEKATVMKYNGTNWVLVDSAGFTAADADYPSLQVIGNTPYVCFSFISALYAPSRAAVMKYNGSNWVYVGKPGFSSGTAQWTSLSHDNGKPVISFADYSQSGKLSTMSYGIPVLSAADTIHVNSTGTYYTVSYDTNGCMTSDTIQVISSTLSAGISSTSHISCFGDSTGRINAKGINGKLPYTYSWNTSDTLDSIVGLPTGKYTVTVTDANSCFDTISETLTQPAILSTSVVVDKYITCFGLSNGQVRTVVSGGTSPYSYSWNTGGNSAVETGLSAGNYYITITDKNSCTDSTSIILSQPNLLLGTHTVTACNSYTFNGITYTANNSTALDTLTNAAGCDSVVTLNLTINNSNTGTHTITACDSYTFNGITYTTSNSTALDTLTNAAGCDSVVTLNLTINNSNTGTHTVTACDSYTFNGITYTANNSTALDTLTNAAGCDSVVTLNLTINNSNTGNHTVTACDSYTFNGITYTASNSTALDTLTNAAGCDSVVTLNLTINNSNTGTHTVTACDSYTFNGITYTANNSTALDTLTNAVGCDSVVTLNLTINNSNTGTHTVTACDSYTFNEITYTSSNSTALDTLTNADGCDSIVTLNLTINNSNTGTHIVTACDSYTFNGITYTANNSTALDTLTNAAGCDSVVTLNLTINNSNTGNHTVTACDSYTFNGITYTSSNSTALDTLTNAAGCDSIVTLNLTINNSNTGTHTVTACDSYTFNGITYTSSNSTALDTLTNADGCDSIVTLNLTINNSNTGTHTVTACDSYTFNGITYTASNSTALDTLTNADGCDSIVTLNLTINNSNTGTHTVTACDSYTFNGITYTSNNSTALDTLTNAAGCDSVVTLNLTINNSNTGNHTVTACDSYTFNGITYTSSNSTALDTLTNAAGCDSVVTLNLTINNSNTGTHTVTACDSYTFNGITYTSSNSTALDTLTNAAGCDSVVTLNLTINNSNTGNHTVTACDSYTFNGITYTASNSTALDTLTNAAGCDSIVTLNLTINNSNTGTHTVTACDSYTFNGITYTANNSTALDTLTNAVGCDSVVTLNLTINNSNTGNHTVTACDSYTFNGITYTSSNSTALDTLTNAAGCDSIVTLNLTINNSNTGTHTVTACDSYTFNGITYTSSNSTALDTLTNADGCDSIVTLNLTIYNSNTGTHTVTACDSYTFNGITYTTSNSTALDTLTNAAGCDSVVTLNLTINNSTSSAFTTNACDTYNWVSNGKTYTSSGVYLDTLTNAAGCDSIVTLNLTINDSVSTITSLSVCAPYKWTLTGITYDSTGIYSDTLSTSFGCDSIVRLDLQVTIIDTVISLEVDNELSVSEPGATYQWLNCSNGKKLIVGANNQKFKPDSSGSYSAIIHKNGCSDTTACYDIIILSKDVPAHQFGLVSVYPNPAQDFITIKGVMYELKHIQILDLLGRDITEQITITWESETILKINLSNINAGTYFLLTKTTKHKILKTD